MCVAAQINPDAKTIVDSIKPAISHTARHSVFLMTIRLYLRQPYDT